MDSLNPFAATVLACSTVFWLVMGVIYGLLRHRDRTRLASLIRLKEDRPTVTRDQFVSWFVQRGVRQSVTEDAHAYLVQRCGVPDFPLTPHDPLNHVCDLDVHEDIADVLRELDYREMDDRDWDVLEHWQVIDVPSPIEPDASVASFVHLIDALHERLAPTSETRPDYGN